MTPLYLASGSVHRKVLLEQPGIPFACLPNDPQAVRQPAEHTAHYARPLPREKAQADMACAAAGSPVLAADILVTRDDIPGACVTSACVTSACVTAACAMLRPLSGLTPQLITALSIAHRQPLLQCRVLTDVAVCTLSYQIMRRHVVTDQPMEKAGADAIQGQIAGFIRLNGRYHRLAGLPSVKTEEWFSAFSRSDTTLAQMAESNDEH